MSDGTQDNQLFLTNSISQKVKDFKPIHDWFKNSLKLITPAAQFARFERFFDENHKFNNFLSQLDTGIQYLGGEEIPFENLPLDDSIRKELKEKIKEGITARISSHPNGERIIITKKEGNLIAKKLVAYHLTPEKHRIKFNMQEESDGSKRIIDLLPAFLEISDIESKKIFIVDELDRSLHTILTRQLLKAYLSCCSVKSRSQLLFTTHDVLLMDQNLFRRDEMWITERNSTGNSSLLSFSEFKDVRYDKDIRKSYLQGRLGGIPQILLDNCSMNICSGETAEKNEC